METVMTETGYPGALQIRVRTCAHCGQRCGDRAGGLGGIMTADGSIDLCHPNGTPPAAPVQRPDCYRRVTVYREPLGALIGVERKPAGIGDIRLPPPPDAPPEGRYRVTIRVERPDGQFVTSETTVPADLMSRPEPDLAQELASGKIAGGFIAAYRRAAELPE